MYRMLFPGIYLVEIPLRNNPLRSLNCYILKGEKSLIIDTGFDTLENQEILAQVLRELDIDPKRTSLFLTHLHSDHTGLAHYLAGLGIKVYIGPDGSFLKDSLHLHSPHWQAIEKLAQKQGLDEDNLDIKEHPGFKFRPKKLPPLNTSLQGQVFEVGDYRLEVLDLPGHTPGLQALYDKDQGLLFSGDHILDDITPNITYWGKEYGDSLGIYLKNLEKVKTLKIKQVFSSHRRLPMDHLKRIDELIDHHRLRLEETKSILENKEAQTVREITMAMNWNIRARDWHDFPSSQKWFAAGEAQAHLVHLRELGLVKEEDRAGILYYSLSNN